MGRRREIKLTIPDVLAVGKLEGDRACVGAGAEIRLVADGRKVASEVGMPFARHDGRTRAQ